MDKILVEEKNFQEIDFTETPLATGDYENCSFVNCNFSDTSLANCVFSACIFNGCNMSTVNLSKTALRDIKFTDCKLLGLHFQDGNHIGFEVSFDNCILNLSSFYTLKLKNTLFKNSSILEADFAEADLTAAIFEHCNLAGTIFENTILEKADFSTAYNYAIDPELNRIKKAKFSAAGITGLLLKYDIEIA